MKNREFGVELEFDSNGLGTHGVGDLLWNNGFREEWTGLREFYDGYYSDSYYGYDRISEDGSEVELRSPILQGESGFKDLRKVVDLLNNHGCFTTEQDGLHVHHNAPDFRESKDLTVRLLKSWKHNEHHIAQFIEEERSRESLQAPGIYGSGSPCPTFDHNQINALERANEVDFTMNLYRTGFTTRNNLNINSLRSHGSVEFRMHEGTLYWPQIEAWIRFGQSFLNGVKSRKNPIETVDSPVVLMNRLKTNKRAQIQLARKAGLVLA